jgi:hypothetical protein
MRHPPLYPQKLTLNSPIGGGRSVDIFRLLTKSHGVSHNLNFLLDMKLDFQKSFSTNIPFVLAHAPICMCNPPKMLKFGIVIDLLIQRVHITCYPKTRILLQHWRDSCYRCKLLKNVSDEYLNLNYPFLGMTQYFFYIQTY